MELYANLFIFSIITRRIFQSTVFLVDPCIESVIPLDQWLQCSGLVCRWTVRRCIELRVCLEDVGGGGWVRSDGAE